MSKIYKDMHIFSGIGGAALGFQQAVSEYRGMVGRFRTLAGIDCDKEACRDFEALTGTPAVQIDLFSREDYEIFHGCKPPTDWREASPEDLFAASGGEYPDVVFLSPPCKGFSALLPKKTAKTEKYQALNRLVVRGLELTMSAFGDDPPAVIMLENVPRITSRGEWLLRQVKYLLSRYGYVFHEGFHCCGEIGGLGQRRKRYLLIARLPTRVSAHVFQPPLRKLKSIGEVIGPLPLPDDPACGPMHRLPRLQWKTWVRLALISAGGDWRDLDKIAPGQYRLKYVPRDGAFRVGQWDEPATTVTGSASVRGSNALAAIADPRLPYRDNRHPAVYKVGRWDEPTSTVTGSRFGSGAPAVADIRTGFKNSTHHAIYRVSNWNEPANTVTGAMRPNNGSISVTDPRLGHKLRNGSSGAAAVSNPRIPADRERLDPPPVIIALDGTWHRPLTTLELAALQGFPVIMPDGRPLQMAGKSDARWRERIGNAVPPPAAQAIAEQILTAVMASERDGWALGFTDTPIWVNGSGGRQSDNRTIKPF